MEIMMVPLWVWGTLFADKPLQTHIWVDKDQFSNCLVDVHKHDELSGVVGHGEAEDWWSCSVMSNTKMTWQEVWIEQAT